MAKVRIEVIPWLSHALDPGKSGRYVATEELTAGRTLRDLLCQLAGKHRAFAELIFDTDRQQIREHVNIVVNDRLLDLAGGLHMELEDGSTVSFLPAYTGGSIDFQPPVGYTSVARASSP
jgi:molybdopterin converting factor small subunit